MFTNLLRWPAVLKQQRQLEPTLLAHLFGDTVDRDGLCHECMWDKEQEQIREQCATNYLNESDFYYTSVSR